MARPVTTREDLLWILTSLAGQPVSINELAGRLYGEDTPDNRMAVSQTIRRLKRRGHQIAATGGGRGRPPAQFTLADERALGVTMDELYAGEG